MGEVDHPKYGKIIKPEYKSLEECFSSWNEDNGDIGFGIAEELRKLDRKDLINFLDDFIETDGYWNADYVWQNCFGSYYKVNDYDSLLNDEIVYYILNCENHGIFKIPSIWHILPEC